MLEQWNSMWPEARTEKHGKIKLQWFHIERNSYIKIPYLKKKKNYIFKKQGRLYLLLIPHLAKIIVFVFLNGLRALINFSASSATSSTESFSLA